MSRSWIILKEGPASPRREPRASGNVVRDCAARPWLTPRARGLRAVFAEAAGVRHRQREEVLRLELAQPAAQALRFAEFRHAIRSRRLRPEQHRNGMPAMTLQLA